MLGIGLKYSELPIWIMGLQHMHPASFRILRAVSFKLYLYAIQYLNCFDDKKKVARVDKRVMEILEIL